MDIEAMYEKNKVLTVIVGVLLLPIIPLIIGFKVYMMLNSSNASKSLDNTQKKDDALAAQENDLKKQANQAVAEADKAAQRIEDRHADGAEADLDWNKKRND